MACLALSNQVVTSFTIRFNIHSLAECSLPCDKFMGSSKGLAMAAAIPNLTAASTTLHGGTA